MQLVTKQCCVTFQDEFVCFAYYHLPSQQIFLLQKLKVVSTFFNQKFCAYAASCGGLNWKENHWKPQYRKIQIISPWLIFVQKAVLLGLFSGELIFRGAYYWKEFCISKWVEFDSKTASTNSPWAYIWEGLLSEGFL